VSTFGLMVLIVAAKYVIFIQGDEKMINALGFAALSTEAVLGLPQIYKNYMAKSTAGLSMVLIGTWFLGDGYKTIFFIMKDLPFQFIMCGAFQLFVDVVIVLQMVIYSSNTRMQQEKHLLG